MSNNSFYSAIGDSIQRNKNEIEKLKKQNLRLKNKNKKLQQRIDKAIDYIEKFIPIDADTILMREKQREYIISILRGEDNE